MNWKNTPTDSAVFRWIFNNNFPIQMGDFVGDFGVSSSDWEDEILSNPLDLNTKNVLRSEIVKLWRKSSICFIKFSIFLKVFLMISLHFKLKNFSLTCKTNLQFSTSSNSRSLIKFHFLYYYEMIIFFFQFILTFEIYIEQDIVLFQFSILLNIAYVVCLSRKEKPNKYKNCFIHINSLCFEQMKSINYTFNR